MPAIATSAPASLPPLPTPPTSDQRYPLVAAREALTGADGQYDVAFTYNARNPDGIMVVFDDHQRCPRPGTAKRAVHDQTIAEWATRLENAGFTNVRTGKCSASGTAPRRIEPITARVMRQGPLDAFRRSVTFEGYGGTCIYEFRAGVTFARYQANDHLGRDIPLAPGTDTHVAIVQTIADYYGFPGPVEVQFAEPGTT